MGSFLASLGLEMKPQAPVHRDPVAERRDMLRSLVGPEIASQIAPVLEQNPGLASQAGALALVALGAIAIPKVMP